MGRRKGVKQTGRVAAQRRERSAQRQAHRVGLAAGTIAADVPEPLVPEQFQAITTTYWQCLKAVPDPRAAGQVVYPLYLILHRIIVGFLSGVRHIGVLFPRQHRVTGPPRRGKRRNWRLSAQPTQTAVYELLRRIDWGAAQEALAPLWERLGYTPEWVMRRRRRDPQEILEAFHRTAAEQAARKAAAEQAARKAAAKQGLSAAQAMRLGRGVRKGKRAAPSRPAPPPKPTAAAPSGTAPAPAVVRVEPVPGGARQDLLLDGKGVRASYNNGCTEHFVHVTAVTVGEAGPRQRFIVGAQATVLDRKGEWGAALSLLETLTPLPTATVALVSGDAGMCVEEHAAWLTSEGFVYLFRIKGNAGWIFERVQQWTDAARTARPDGDLDEACRLSGGQLHSRRLWRLPGLRHASFPGITEGFVIEKKAWTTRPRNRNGNIILPVTRGRRGRGPRFWNGFFCTGTRKPACSASKITRLMRMGSATNMCRGPWHMSCCSTPC